MNGLLVFSFLALCVILLDVIISTLARRKTIITIRRQDKSDQFIKASFNKLEVALVELDQAMHYLSSRIADSIWGADFSGIEDFPRASKKGESLYTKFDDAPLVINIFVMPPDSLGQISRIISALSHGKEFALAKSSSIFVEKSYGGSLSANFPRKDMD